MREQVRKGERPLPTSLAKGVGREQALDIANAMLRPHDNQRLAMTKKARCCTTAYNTLHHTPVLPNLDWLINCVSIVDGQRVFRCLMSDDKFNVYTTVVDLPVADDCSPLEFLTAVMHFKTLPVIMRLDAAKNAAYYVHPRMMAVKVDDGSGKVSLDIRGGLPSLPGAKTMMPGQPPIIDAEPQRSGQWRKKKKRWQPSSETKK